MTSPPRLAPLESEELDALLARVCLPTFTERERDIARHAAREAQRLARARARQEALEEAIQCVFESSYAIEHCDGERCDTEELVKALEALRNREEA